MAVWEKGGVACPDSPLVPGACLCNLLLFFKHFPFMLAATYKHFYCLFHLAFCLFSAGRPSAFHCVKKVGVHGQGHPQKKGGGLV